MIHTLTIKKPDSTKLDKKLTTKCKNYTSRKKKITRPNVSSLGSMILKIMLCYQFEVPQ